MPGSPPPSRRWQTDQWTHSPPLRARIAAAIRARFAKVVATRARADENVHAGREFVAEYAAYVHYVEAAHALATRRSSEVHHIHATARDDGEGHEEPTH